MDGEGKKTASRGGKKGRASLKPTPKVKRGGATSVKTQKKKRASKKKPVTETSEQERLADLIKKRDEATQARVDLLSMEQMKRLVDEMMKRNPSFVFNVVEEISKTNEEGEPLPPSSSETPHWCVCSNCREMPTMAENVCCKGTPDSCVSQFPEFTLLILEPGVLNIANDYRNDFFALTEEDEEDINKSFRHTAYRQFVLWRCGYLGANNRKVIPSCCVWTIRDKYPSPHGVYTGFKPDRLA